jgi:multicomponent Na+:H+ antiporter subunit E
LARAITLPIVLAILWLLLSGHYDAWLLSLGALSVALSTWLAMRMHLPLADEALYHPTPRLLRYWAWLVVEIVRANIDVARRVVTPGLPIDPVVIRVPASQRGRVGRVTYANSITLTPGTVSLEVDDSSIEVHALTSRAADSLAAGAMDRHVAEAETGTR